MPFDFRHASYERRDGEISYFVAERSTILLADEVHRRTSQLVQVQFHLKTGALFVQAPYFRAHGGLLGACSVDVDAELRSSIQLGESGVTTSHKVKYSHPIDGNAHFSQDGKIYTKVRRQALRLDSQHGHLFEFHALGVSGFDTLKPGQERKNRLYLPFASIKGCDAASVTGEWVSKESLRRLARERGRPIMPVDYIKRRRDDALFLTCLLGHPREDLQSHSLLSVSLSPVPQVGSVTEPSLVFMGGWDADQLPVRPHDRLGFLAYLYPCANLDQMRARLGSVDYDGGDVHRAG